MIFKLQIAVFLLGSLLQAASTESEEADPCQGKVGIFPNPDDCTTYLICQNGISEIANCPDGLLFDRYKRTCDRNVTVNCSDAGASDLPPYQTGVRSDDVVCESNNCSCIYPSETSCSQYYRCEDGMAYLEQCSEGLLMNPETLTCDYAEDVTCAVSAEDEQEDPCQGKVGVFSNPDDCTTYLLCQNGISEIVSCPRGLLFDRYKRTCDRNATVACSDAGATDLPPYQTGVRSDDVVCESSNCSCIYPSNTSCSQYFRCEDGKAYVEQCSEGLLMNPETLTCDYAEDVTCAVSAEDEQEDPCQGKVGVFSNPDDCTTYLLCQNGISEIVSCPEGLLFDRYKRTCDRNATVACSDAGATDLPPYQTGVRSDDVVCESSNCSCIYPSNTSCSQYYRCEDGRAYVEQCSEGLLMNPETLTCDYAEDVTCDITPSYDTSSPTITAYYLSSGSDLEDYEFLSSTTKEEINNENDESTLYPTTELRNSMQQNTFTDGNTGNNFDENERGTTVRLTSEAEFSGNTIGDDAVTFSESYSLPDSTDGTSITGMSGDGTFTQPSSVMPEYITSEDLTSTSFTKTERDLLTTVMSTVTKYFFTDKPRETTSEIYPTTKEETTENGLKTDLQSVSTSESTTLTPMPYKTSVNAESTLLPSSALSTAMTGELTVTEISPAITKGQIESTEENLTSDLKSTSTGDISESTIHTSITEFIKSEDNFSQETTSSDITESIVKLTSPVTVFRTTDSELSFDDTTTNDNSVYTKDSSAISHDIVELSTLHINQTETTNPDEIKDASNLPVDFNVTTTLEETSTGTAADVGTPEIEPKNMTNVPSLEITDSSEKEYNETAVNVFDATTNFIDLTSETQDPFASSLSISTLPSGDILTETTSKMSTYVTETSVTKLTSPSKETSKINSTDGQDTSTNSDLIDSKPTSIIFTTENIASKSTNESNTETATSQPMSETQNDTIISDMASSSPTEFFTFEPASELSTATEGKPQYTSKDIIKETNETESVATNTISTTAGHTDMTTELVEISSETQDPTTTFATKFTALPVGSSSFITGSETDSSSDIKSIMISTDLTTSAPVTTRNDAFTSDTASENPTKKTTSESVLNSHTESFVSLTSPKSSTVNEVTQHTTTTEADTISSMEITGETVIDSTTKLAETTSATQFILPSQGSSSITAETDMFTVKKPTVITSTPRSTASEIGTEPRTDLTTFESTTETRSEISVSETMSELPTETFTSETSSESNILNETVTQYPTTSSSIDSTEIVIINSVPTTTEHFIDSTTELTELTSKTQNPKQSTKPESDIVSTITEQFIDSTTDFTEVTSRMQDLTSVAKFTASSLGSSSIITESEANKLTTMHSSAASTVSATESRTETSSTDAVTVTLSKIVSPETASKTSTSETVSDLLTDPFTSETVIETSTASKTNAISENTETGSVINTFLPTTVSVPTSVTNFTVTFQGSSTITTGSEINASTDIETITSTAGTATSNEVIETRTDSATVQTVTETQSKISRSDLVSDLPTESVMSETVPQSTTVTEDLRQYSTTEDTKRSSENVSSTITSEPTTRRRFIEFTTEFPELISETGNPESITKVNVPSQGISTTVTGSETNISMISHPTTITSITESATPKTVTKIQTETSVSETETDVFTDPFTTTPVSEMNSATESITHYTTKDIREDTETESVSTAVPTIANQFTDSTTEFTEMTSETQNATSVTKFTATSQSPSGTATELKRNTSTVTETTVTSTNESTSDVVTEILTESVIPENATETPAEVSPTETVTDFLTKSFTTEIVAESSNPTEDVTQYTITSSSNKNATETDSIISTPATSDRFVDITTETKKSIVTKFTAPFEKTSSNTAQSEIDKSTNEEPTSFISTGGTVSADVTETRSETPRLETITVSQEKTVSDLPTKSFTIISEIITPTETITQFTLTSIDKESTESSPVTISSVPTTSDVSIVSTTEFMETSSETENVTSVLKFSTTPEGSSSPVTESEVNISTVAETRTTNSTTESTTSAIVTEVLTESATPETVTETGGEISPSETMSDFLTKSFTSETVTESNNPTEDITQFTTTSGSSKKETETESVTSTPTIADGFVDTTTETKNPVVTKFTVPFEKTSSTMGQSEIDMSSTDEPTSFTSTGSAVPASVTETRTETPSLETVTVSQEETVSDLPTKSFTTISEMSTPTENITQYTTKVIGTERTETETVSVSVPKTTEQFIDSTVEFTEVTSKTENTTSVTKSTATSQGFSSSVTEPRTITSTAGSTSAVVTEIRTESATSETVTETRGETSPSETMSDFLTKSFTSETVAESSNPTEEITQYNTTSSINQETEIESITITSAPTTTERFIDSTTETKKPAVTKFTAPFERTSSITAESEVDITMTTKPTSFSFTTGSTASAIVTEIRTGSAIPETVTGTRAKTMSDLLTESFTTNSVSESSTANESIKHYTTKDMSKENTETEPVKTSVATSTVRLVNSTTEVVEMTPETHNPITKFTAPSQGTSSTATESEPNISTIMEPDIVTSTAESTSSVVTAFSTESVTPGTITETKSETSAVVTMSDLHTQPSTFETASESEYTSIDVTEYTSRDVTEYTTNDVSRKSSETETTTAATVAEQFTDSPAEFTEVTAETKNSTETFVTKFTAYETLSSSDSTASEIHTSINTKPVTISSTAGNSFEIVTVSPVETSTSETTLEIHFQSSTSKPSSESISVSEVKESTTISTMCLDPNGMYPHPTNCKAFYKCTDGVPVLSLCVGDEHFNPRDHLCQDPCLALCDNTIDCSGMTSSPSSMTTEEFSTSANINTTLMTEATSYGTTETDETLSDSSNKETGFTNEFSSTPSDNEISSTSIVSEVTAVEDNRTETKISTLITSPETFTSFETTLETAKTTLSDISSTGSSEETNGSSTSVFSTTTTGASTFMSTTVYDIDKTESTICQDPNGLYPSLNDCRSFIMCIGGEPYETQCDEQLHFSPLTQHCEFPCIAKCDPTLDCSSTNPPIATSAIPFIKCPQKDLFPVYEQCDYYFDCADTFPKIQSCPVGLTFNATTRVCDWPENAECGSSLKALPESDDSFDCPCETCLIPSMSNCNAYYFCLNYKAYPMECSNGLLFDQSLNTCNYQSKTLCDITSTTVTTTSTTTTTAVTPSTTQSYKCPERNGMFKDPSNCRSFIHCSNYWPYIKECPGGLHFSVELQRCEWPCEAKCDLTLPCVAAQQAPASFHLPSTTVDPLCPCKNCRVSNPESCTKYIECKNGISKRKNCPRGQTFDHERQRCDWAHKVDCPYSQICPRSNGLFLYKDDCHRFVHCSNGIPYIKTCPGELEFDPRTLRCEWPAGKCVSAKPELSGRTEEIDEELFEEKWACPEKFGYFSHEISCSKFYHCSFGTPHLKECSDGLSYNPLYQTCDWQKNVKCGSHEQHYRRRCRRYDRQILCPQNKTHVAHPHCDMFYDCSTGSPCPKRCPNGLFFNSITRMCDTAENVNCLKRDGEVYSLKTMADICHRKGKGQMQDPANDSCFYKCHNHKVIRGCCSRNRIFNEKSDNCMLKTFIPLNKRIFG